MMSGATSDVQREVGLFSRQYAALTGDLWGQLACLGAGARAIDVV